MIVPRAVPVEVQHSTAGRRGMRILLCVVGTLLTFVIASPIALSSQDLVAWAESTLGLGLSHGWALLVFVSLDAAAATCVGMVVYSAWRGETAGAFGLLVWAFAGGSAVANYRHGRTTEARDDQWFFLAMSLAGPALLEVVMRRVRRWVQTTAGRYERPLPHFRLVRWMPGIAFRETLCAWKLAVTEGYSRPEEAITAARVRRVTTPAREETRQVIPTADLVTVPFDARDDGEPTRGQGTVTSTMKPPRPTRVPKTPPPTSNGARPVGGRTARIIADIRDGMRYGDIASKHGVSTKTVQRTAKRIDVPVSAVDVTLTENGEDNETEEQDE